MTSTDDVPCTDSAASAAAAPSTAAPLLTSHAIPRIARLHRAAAGRLLRRVGLHPGQEFLMMLLWDQGPQRQAELIKTLELDASTVTRMVQRLEQAGLVARTPDPVDGRAMRVEATGPGHALRADVERVWRELEEQTVAGLDDGERREFARLLARVEGNLCRASATAAR
ncbi:MarR family winged helix-turn-helix transcriptional regulator [Streptomyces sp. NPDC057654]|uniref:MarR family winged helix-turn-helix transcriptional regulator n=1 Tax=Streptomyces sp. NPDC057654 TaxID=3346196 RepID=UPI0036A7271F